MPKVTSPRLPLSGLFAIYKPSGPTSMSVLEDIKKLICQSPLFVEREKLETQQGRRHGKGKRAKDRVKIGQGGTLDPLADGVLVIGVGKGTKRLNEFLDCVKEYHTTALLGCETDSYDSEGAQVRVAPWRHITKEVVETMLERFRGEIYQTPPIFSALKMDGKPLYEYARSGTPLPRPIEKRKVIVHSLELVSWLGSDHNYRWPEKQFTIGEKEAMAKALGSVEKGPVVGDEPDPTSDRPPAAFALSMKVSGGTYVRSIVHDLGHALGSAAHVVTLTRLRQGRFTTEAPESEQDKSCVPWEVFERAKENEGEGDESGYREWEREVLDRFDIVEGKNQTQDVP
ncbi:pseudouridine synthase [Pisolithus orientalis]|uniref:pseudouridine synthase n=1 Tax=Pisolithus orientalis TaxID=936130 RepID=UPI0022243E17|nr:pseudouridine synthase [Pisolithus orientalis]KAI6028697.1 pseudouridine synthase [Pisolithus orientalis]